MMTTAIGQHGVRTQRAEASGAPLREVGEVLRSPSVVEVAGGQKAAAKVVLTVLLVTIGLAATLQPLVVIVGAALWVAGRAAMHLACR